MYLPGAVNAVTISDHGTTTTNRSPSGTTPCKRSATLDPNLAKHPAAGIQLSDADKQALVAFLKTLTDERVGVISSTRGGN